MVSYPHSAYQHSHCCFAGTAFSSYCSIAAPFLSNWRIQTVPMFALSSILPGHFPSVWNQNKENIPSTRPRDHPFSILASSNSKLHQLPLDERRDTPSTSVVYKTIIGWTQSQCDKPCILTSRVNLESPINLTKRFFDCGRKPEYLCTPPSSGRRVCSVADWCLNPAPPTDSNTLLSLWPSGCTTAHSDGTSATLRSLYIHK